MLVLVFFGCFPDIEISRTEIDDHSEASRLG